MSKYILIGYYFLFSILLIYYSIKNPVPNWDMIAYVACAKSFVISDKQELHKYVYSELKNSVPKETYKFLTKGGPGFRELTEKDAEYRETLEKDSDAFAEALIFFKVRLIYNGFVFFMSNMGVNIFLATHLVSAVSTILGLWFIFIAFRPYIANLLMYSIPPLGMALGLLELTKLSGPDGMAFMMVSISAYLLLEKQWKLLLLILPVIVLVRTDLIIFSLIVPLHILFFGYYRKSLAIISLLSSLLTFYIINAYYGYYGWQTLMYHTFIQPLTNPGTSSSPFTISNYIDALYTGFKVLPVNNAFFVYLSLCILTVYCIPKKLVTVKRLSMTTINMYFIALSSLFYVLLHFLLFPVSWERFFFGQYILGLCFLLWLLTDKVQVNTQDKKALSSLS